MIKPILIMLSVFLTNAVCYADANSNAELLFKKIYPNVTYKNFKPAPIDGLYELAAGPNIIYFHPKTGHLIFGEIYSSKGVSLTEKSKKLINASIEPPSEYSQAVVIGNGPHTIVEISDPDCPYCRMASKYISERNDVTRYVYFLSLPSHPYSQDKVRYILCSADPAEAYKEIYEGRFDAVLPTVSTGCNVDTIMEYHREVAMKTGVYGTPVFWVDGSRVDGADLKLIKQLLEKN